MLNESAISISGLTPSAHCFHCCPDYISEASFADTVAIAECDPDMKSILTACVSVTLADYKVLCTAAGKMLVISFLESSTITFVAANCLATKHRVSFCLARCMAMKVDKDCSIKSVRLCIEDFTVIPISARMVGVTSLITAVPEFRSHRRDEENSVRCDIKIRRPSTIKNAPNGAFRSLV